MISTANGPRWVLALTGGIGSGKSAVAERLAALGAGVVDTDRVAHALTAPGGAAMPALAAAFGPEIVQADGAMDRAAMRARVFADPQARQQLEAILHPMIRVQTEAELATCPGIIWCWWCRSWWKPEPICHWPTGCWWWTARWTPSASGCAHAMACQRRKSTPFWPVRPAVRPG